MKRCACGFISIIMLLWSCTLKNTRHLAQPDSYNSIHYSNIITLVMGALFTLQTTEHTQHVDRLSPNYTATGTAADFKYCSLEKM